MRGMSEGVGCEGLCSVCMNIVDNAYRTLRYRECGEVVGKRGRLNLNQKPRIRAKQSKEHSILFHFRKNSL